MANKYEAQSREAQAATKRIIACSRKRSFSSKDEALLCQPSQRAYLCPDFRRWHLASGVHFRKKKQRPK